jgi:hypothetical protein
VGLRLPRETAKSRRCFAPRNPRPDAEYAFQDFKLIEARRPPLNDQYDEWLARIIRYAFSVPVSPFVSQVNRATGETMRQQMHPLVQAQTPAFPGLRTKREHFLDRLRRSWHSQLQWRWCGRR